jgi:hypothetical protein
VLDPVLDQEYPQLPAALADHPHPTDYARILSGPQAGGDFPFWSAAPDEQSWCYYFEQADLARQQGDWTHIAKLGEVAFSLDDAPNHAAERTPFIEGYAQVGDWERAAELTAETLRINPLTQPMLCTLWQHILDETSASAERSAAQQDIDALITCP